MDRSLSDAWLQRKRDNLEAFVDRDGLVKIAFFGGLDTLNRGEDPGCALGSRNDLTRWAQGMDLV